MHLHDPAWCLGDHFEDDQALLSLLPWLVTNIYLKKRSVNTLLKDSFLSFSFIYYSFLSFFLPSEVFTMTLILLRVESNSSTWRSVYLREKSRKKYKVASNYYWPTKVRSQIKDCQFIVIIVMSWIYWCSFTYVCFLVFPVPYHRRFFLWKRYRTYENHHKENCQSQRSQHLYS